MYSTGLGISSNQAKVSAASVLLTMHAGGRLTLGKVFDNQQHETLCVDQWGGGGSCWGSVDTPPSWTGSIGYETSVIFSQKIGRHWKSPFILSKYIQTM